MKKDYKHSSLNDRQAAFVREYLLDKNATQAAIRAGYSPKTAKEMGCENLTKPHIIEAVNAGLMDLAAQVGITSVMVLRERKRIAFFDPRRLFDSDGTPIPIQDLDDDTAASITGLDVMQVYSGEVPAVIKKYRIAAKDTSLAALEKFFGLNEKPLRFVLPKITNADDCTMAACAVLNAVANGEMLPSEGQVLSGLIDAQRRAYETSELSVRMKAIEAQLQTKGVKL